jgi:XTP/dITP diphosphohydrolase
MREIRAIFREFPVPLVDLTAFPGTPEVEETGATLEENALLKAQSAHELTGDMALADDSGLFVEALDGRPGVYSSRFAGEGVSYSDNNDRLLELMKGIPLEKRAARFVCVVALIQEKGDPRIFSGKVAGWITTRPEGERGFGYDPVFYHPPSGRTFAQMSPEEKNRISHRYQAFSCARQYLETIWAL